MRMWRRVLPVALLCTLLVSMGAGCLGGGSGNPNSAEPVTLTYWRVFDGERTFDDIISRYRAMHPNVSIDYKELRPEEYDEELVRAIAEGRGPDMFSVHNTKIGEFQSLMLPMPNSMKISYLEVQGSVRKKTVMVEKEETSISQKTLKQRYVDVVAKDVIRAYQPDPKLDSQDRVFGLPLSVDTMVLYYNKDLLNAAGIAEAPTTWDAFQSAVIAITKLNANGDITQSAAAMGSTENVERSSDLISLLMMQNGAIMTDPRGRVSFHLIPEGTPEGINPSLDAVHFYTDFANPTKEVYTWNDDFANSFDAFARGQTAFFFGYSYHIPYLKAAAPKLNYEIAKMPQIAGGKQVNIANYWVESVAKGSKHPDYAWHFLQFAADQENVATYLEQARKPTALRGLINSQVNDEELGPFVEQILTADSWYRGKDEAAMEKALADLAESILLGVEKEMNFVNQAAQIINDTY